MRSAIGLSAVDGLLGFAGALCGGGNRGGDGLAGRCGNAHGGAVLLALGACLVRAYGEHVIRGAEHDSGHGQPQVDGERAADLVGLAQDVVGADHEHTPGPQVA